MTKEQHLRREMMWKNAPTDSNSVERDPCFVIAVVFLLKTKAA